MFFWGFCKISKNTVSYGAPLVAASILGAMVDMSATQRLNNVGPIIGPCGKTYLAVTKDEQFESVCTKRCLCYR